MEIYNGGLELGLFKIVGDDALSEKDKQRKKLLESLPKNTWVRLDDQGNPISEKEALAEDLAELSRFGIIKK